MLIDWLWLDWVGLSCFMLEDLCVLEIRRSIVMWFCGLDIGLILWEWEVDFLCVDDGYCILVWLSVVWVGGKEDVLCVMVVDIIECKWVEMVVECVCD